LNNAKKDPAPLSIIKYWELVFFLGYALILGIVVIPDLKWDFDGHHVALLTTSIRIWAGQVPFRDFYPWYGPLYHYLLALFVGLMGNDLYAVKIYIDIISPLLSMLILVMALRNFDLPALARLFVLIGSISFGLERIYYCGSLRSILPVFLVSWLFRIFRNHQKLPYLFYVPCGVLLFLFSPESGLYSILSSLWFIGAIMFLIDDIKERTRVLEYYLIGALLGLIIMVILVSGTGWFKNYLEYISVINDNFYWSHGISSWYVHDHPVFLQFLSLPLIYLIAIVAIAVKWFHAGKLPQYFLLVTTMTLLGILLAYKLLMEFHSTRFQYSFLPALILAGLAWAPPYRPVKIWKIIPQAILAVFLITGRKAAIPEISPAPYHGQDYKNMMGVRVSPQLAELYEKTGQQFKELNMVGRVAIPLAGAEYAYLGRVPQLPFDSLHYGFHPQYQQLYFDAFKKQNYTFLLISEEGVSWDYTQDAVDTFFDYIDSNYSQILQASPLHAYAVRKEPVELVKVLKKQPGPFILDKRNNFLILLEMPPDPDIMFVEFKTNFDYRFKWLSRFSMPIVELSFDNKKWHYTRPETGRKRINPLPGEHSFRAYFQYPAKTLTVQITFPGMLNVPPDLILITDIKWSTFGIKNFSVRTREYKLEP